MPTERKVKRPWIKSSPNPVVVADKQPQHGANREVYASERWKQASQRHRRDLPFCVRCLAEKVFTDCSPGKRAGVTDHILPINAGGDIWDESNWQVLCNRHHAKKSRSERKGKR